MPTVTQVEAKKVYVELSDGAVSPTWTQIGGFKSIVTNFPVSDTDATTFDTAGWTAKLVMERGLVIKAMGFLKVDPSTGVQDPGQLAAEAAAQATGAGSVKDMRVTIPLKSDLSVLRRYACSATVSLEDQGGGNNDLETWGVTLTSYGVVTRT